MDISHKISRTFVFSILFSLFVIGYVLSPYWIIPSHLWLRILLLAISAVLGLAWAYMSSGKLDKQFHTPNWFLLLLFLIFLGFINFRPLNTVIPWRGDEDFHIGKTLELWRLMRVQGILVLFLMALFLFEGWRKSRFVFSSAIILVLFVVLIVSYSDGKYEFNYGSIRRYPYFSKWFGVFTLYPFVPFTGVFKEMIYRIPPFVSTVLLGWLCAYKLERQNKLIALMFAMAVGTLPLIIYYTSILYLEMPVVFLMTVVCFAIKDLLDGNLKTLTTHPAWYALILIGFLKETTLPFIFAFVLLHFVIRFRSSLRMKSFLPGFIDEAKIVFCVVFPLTLYLFYRSYFGVWRKFTPSFMNLLEVDVYLTLGQAFWDQFGLFILISIAGAMVLFLKKEYKVLSFLTLAFILDVVFHIIDELDYIGYSRFNLFLVPILVASAYYFLLVLNQKKMVFAAAILSGVIVINTILSPVNLDGTKKPFWGNYRLDVSEHYYPYREAILWLKENHALDKIRFSGLVYPYFFSFYFAQFNWMPLYDIQYLEPVKYGDQRRDEAAILQQVLFKAKADGVPIVLFQVLGNTVPKVNDTQGFVQVKIFGNQAHILVLYSLEEK